MLSAERCLSKKKAVPNGTASLLASLPRCKLSLVFFSRFAFVAMTPVSAMFFAHFFELCLLIGRELGHHLLVRALAQILELRLLLVRRQRCVVFDCLRLLLSILADAPEFGLLLGCEIQFLSELLSTFAALSAFVLLGRRSIGTVTAGGGTVWCLR